MSLDFEKIVARAEFYRPQMSAFLRDMIAIPSESCEEEKVVQRIKPNEMGFRKPRPRSARTSIQRSRCR